ncbi:MAG: hypothetical protein JXP34_26640 [Planctomycetes bacterium]|nr:hypothetical protein [Planctomycetota bacterium]
MRILFVLGIGWHALAVAAAAPMPSPGAGLIISREDLGEIRTKIREGVPAAMWDAVVADLPRAAERLEKLLASPPPPDVWGRPTAASGAIGTLAETVPAIAFHYLVTGDPRHVALARRALLLVAPLRRAGWFTWEGGAFPHIDAGRLNRVVVVGYDWLHDALAEDDREAIRGFIAAAVEDFFRINLPVPGAPMHHFRAHNQGNNQMASAVLGALALLGRHPDAERWVRALVDTVLWDIAHAFGPMGQDTEGDLGAYWMISVDAFAQIAVAFRNAIGIDLIRHPYLRSAVDGVILHLAPCPPAVFPNDGDAYDRSWDGLVWVHDKPACTPHRAQVSSSFLLLAKALGDPRALALWQESHARGGKLDRHWMAMPHLGNLGGPLGIAWYPSGMASVPIDPPSTLFTDRLAMMRSAPAAGGTYLLANGGDLTLISRGEVLGTGLGLVWHHPWSQYALAQNTVWTEGIDLAPSFRVVDARDAGGIAYVRIRAASSNVFYYRNPVQERAHEAFETCEREIAFAGGRYLVLRDRIAHAEPRAHTWVWNTLDIDHGAAVEIEPAGHPGAFPRAVISRPGARLAIDFIEPGALAFETREQPLMPVWNFAWGDHGIALFARAGRDDPLPAEGRMRRAFDPTTWGPYDARAHARGRTEGSVETGILREDSGSFLRLTGFRGRPALCDPDDIPVRAPGEYRLSVTYRKENLRHYHHPSWAIWAIFLDAEGRVIEAPRYQDPTAAWAGDRDYDTLDADWTTTSRRFSVPAGVAQIRVAFRCFDTPGTAQGHRKDEGKRLDIARVELERLPDPVREKRVRFLAILQPVGPGEAAPRPVRMIPGAVEMESGERVSLSWGTDPPPGAPLFEPRADHLREFAEAMRPWIDRLAAERDRYAAHANLARGAKATASSAYDDRFSPERAIDGIVAEGFGDGTLRNDLPPIRSGRLTGYGSGDADLYGAEWSYRIRPSYWLAANEEKGAWIEIALERAARIGLVRILNTTNGGFNDRASLDIAIELRDGEDRVVARETLTFGKAFPGPVSDASPPYAKAYRFWYDPATPIPHGEGFREVRFDGAPEASRIRVTVGRYWGFGAGLNEIQAYGPDALEDRL